MSAFDLIADTTLVNLEMLRGTLSDFSDADMLVRPVPGANHAAWQLGHVVFFEHLGFASMMPAGALPQLPPGMESKRKLKKRILM